MYVKNFNDMTIEDIRADINRLLGESGEILFDICERLFALDKKGNKHPLHKDRIYRNYEVVALQKVIPPLVLFFNGNVKYISLFSKYNEQTQKMIIADHLFVTAIIDSSSGNIIESKKSVRVMSASQIARVFPGTPDGKPDINTYSVQWALLNEELEEKRQKEDALEEERKNAPTLPRIRAEEDKIIVKEEEFSIEEIKEFLKTLGYNVVKLPKN